MSLIKISAFALAGLVSLGIAAGGFAQDAPVPDPALAAMSHEDLVEARQAAMREDGGLLRAAGGLTGAEAVAAADTLIRNFTNFSVMFPEGSIVGDSKALPVIWEEKEAFDAIFLKARDASIAMKAAAEAGDAAAYGAAMKAVGGTCGECHQNYRGS